MSDIKSVQGRRMWDSRGNPTVEVEVTLDYLDYSAWTCVTMLPDCSLFSS